MVKAGVAIQTINIGGMQFKDGRVQVTKAISVYPEDVQAFRDLIALGVKLDCRVVATDKPQDFVALLNNVKF